MEKDNTLFMKTLLILLFFISFYPLKSQTINNVQAKQDGNIVTINYDLESDNEAIISLYLSQNGGVSFKGPLINVSGDVGNGVKPGPGSITWNVLKEQDMITGDNIVFRVKGFPKFGTLTDIRDGKIYKTVRIGNQVWMAENLAYKPIDGNFWVYNNDKTNIEKYGYLYDWQTASTICPNSWHLPSKE